MRLADFILSNLERILADWVEFARTRISAGRGMTDLALRNDAEHILREVARDMTTQQSDVQQESKSQGTNAPDSDWNPAPAHSHALQRARSGFEVNQMVSEFRALRATVLRLWSGNGAPDAQDFNDVIRFNEAIDQALSESLKHFVSEVDRARSLFLGTLGHDLRTPLNTIGTCATIIRLRSVEESRETEMIQRSAARMRELVDVVLAYTRRSLGAVLPISVKPMNLGALVGDCVRELSVTNEGREIALTLDGDLGGVWDAVRMAQVTSNLVGNALKYGAAEEAVRVTLDGSDAEEVVLKVQNFGDPIPDELLSDIFEPLFRGTDAGGTAQGGGANMGLGLYIAREVVSAHGGSIRVTSDEATGTVFDVRLPRSGHIQPTANA